MTSDPTTRAMPAQSRGVVLVMPRRSTEWAGAAAVWITASGWASAARRRVGQAWVATPDGVATPEETLGFMRNPPILSRPRMASHVPMVARTGIKDLMRARAAWGYRDVGERSEWSNAELKFVWQHHDLFHNAGHPLAQRRQCPLVTFVHSAQVSEARAWGVRRPGWGRLLEHVAERPQLLTSDVIACVSDEVAAEVVRIGADEHRVLISPMAVDADQFSPVVSGEVVRRRFGLEGRFVVGWTGSFRRFHALEVAIEAFAKVYREARDSRLLLVGDGFERQNIERLAISLGLDGAVVFTGGVPHGELPEYIAAMDVTIVTARAGQAFHYSPLKMREYLASQRAVVAPRIGDVSRTVTDNVDALLYEPGDVNGLAERILLLHDAPGLRARIGSAGRHLMSATGTWDAQLETLLNSDPFRRALSHISATTASSRG